MKGLTLPFGTAPQSKFPFPEFTPTSLSTVVAQIYELLNN